MGEVNLFTRDRQAKRFLTTQNDMATGRTVHFRLSDLTGNVFENVLVWGAFDDFLREFVVQFIFGSDDGSSEPNVNDFQTAGVQFPQYRHCVSVDAR